MRTVYHVTKAKHVSAILKEGLKPLATNRTKEIEVVDHGFDLAAKELGLTPIRKGSFAWPNRPEVMFNESVVLEVAADPHAARVFHQAWMDLAWGIVGGVLGRIPQQHVARFRDMKPEDLFGEMRHIPVFEGLVGDVILRLGRRYYQTAVLLQEYNPEIAQLLSRRVAEAQPRFPGLMPYLDHEVALGTDPISIERIRQL